MSNTEWKYIRRFIGSHPYSRASSTMTLVSQQWISYLTASWFQHSLRVNIIEINVGAELRAPIGITVYLFLPFEVKKARQSLASGSVAIC